jgi:pimeloyl-ACP methyl ester carboxylesterase
VGLECLLVPGTGGVTFKDDQGNAAGSVFDLIVDRDDANEVLTLRHARNQLAPTHNRLAASVDLSIVYTWFDEARKLSGKRLWQTLAYDWRVDIRVSGAQLVEKLRADTTTTWHLVGHSQGGAVILEAARQMGAAGFAERVRSVVFVGVPFFGTHNATLALVRGAFFGNRIGAATTRTWPSLYQMMPRWDLETLVIDRVPLLTTRTWRLAHLLGAPNDVAAGIDPDLLARGVAWSQLHPTPRIFDNLRRLKWVRIVAGNNRQTPVGYRSFPNVGSESVIRQLGDETVADFQTYRHLPAWVRDEVSNVRMETFKHFLMGNDERVYDWCVP